MRTGFSKLLGTAATALVGSAFLTVSVSAADPTPYAKINAAAAASPIRVQTLRGGVSELDGSGGNIGVLANSQGIFMVDAGIAVSQKKIEAALKRIKPTRISYVIDTHWHWDHTDGNAWAHKDGATLIASPQTARHLGETIRIAEWGHTFAPVPAGARPTMLVSSEKRMQFGGETIRIRPYMHSHTDGDLSVYFVKADVLFTGDTWWNGLYPFIDHEEGGGINGMIAAADANIAMTTDHTIVVPGHGPVGNRAQMIEYRNMLVAIRDNVAALKKKGLSLQQIIAAKPTRRFDAKWGQAIISPALFTSLVYTGV